MLINEDELICDMAETYHVLDYKSLPISLLATLANGLRDDSRSKMLLTESKITIETTLLAGIFDRLSLLLWSKTKDGQKNINRPEMILQKLMPVKKDDELSSFASGEEFEKARQEILKGVN